MKSASGELNLAIAHDTIVSQVAAFLYATKQLPESIHIEDIQFGSNTDGLTPLKIQVRKDKKEVQTIISNG